MTEQHCPGCKCSQDRFVAARLDIWKSALGALTGAPYTGDVDAADTLYLAEFLAGDKLMADYTDGTLAELEDEDDGGGETADGEDDESP